MMHSMPFLPEDIENVTPHFYSSPHYFSVRDFLRSVEKLCPEVTRDLQAIANSYTLELDEELTHYRETSVEVHTLNYWLDFCNMGTDSGKFVREQMKEWAWKYHLDGSINDIYLQIAFLQVREIVGRTDMLKRMSKQNDISREPIVGEDFGVSFEDNMFLEGYHSPRISDGMQGADALPFILPVVFMPTETTNHMVLNTSENESRQTFIKGVAWDKRTEESWAEFKKRMVADFKKYLNGYKQEVDRFFENEGYDNSDEKDKSNMHLEWLALWQIGEMTHEEIADEYSDKYPKDRSITGNNVGKNIRPLAKMALLNYRNHRDIRRRK